MTFNSFIYKPNPKKIKEDRMSLIYLTATVIAFFLVFIFFVRGVLGFAFFLFLSGGLIKLKLDEIKSKGANRFGTLPFAFVISTDKIVIGSSEYATDNMTDLKIDAEDFVGGPGGDILSSSIGTDNYIEFYSGGEKHAYQFLVKKRSDLVMIGQLYKEIQKRRV